jgi:hypothetical protein
MSGRDESAKVDFFVVLESEMYYIKFQPVPARSKILKIFQYIKSNYPNAE